jgi:hypothetical protein
MRRLLPGIRIQSKILLVAFEFGVRSEASAPAVSRHGDGAVRVVVETDLKIYRQIGYALLERTDG